MDSSSLYQGNSIFRNQPSYTRFNKTFEEAKDVLFLQIEEINPHFLTDKYVNDKTGFSQNILLDPRTKKEQIKIEYDHSSKGNKQKPFKGGGIKSALTKEQHKTGLRVLLAQQECKELEEADLIIWHKFQTKLQKERRQMQEYVREYEETQREEIYAPTKRLDELYRKWFLQERDSYIKSQPDQVAFNTHTGMPLVNLCKTINEDPIEISNLELLSKRGFVRLYQDDRQIDWQNLNFRLNDFAQSFNESQEFRKNNQLKEEIKIELECIDEKSVGKNFCIPMKTLLFLLTAGDIDLPTEVLLEIVNSHKILDGKTIMFANPLPAHNCGYHTHQKVVEQCFAAFMSAKGRAKWLEISQHEVRAENENLIDINVGGVCSKHYEPIQFEKFVSKNEKHFESYKAEDVKENLALLKWYLKSPSSKSGLKILTTLNLPPATNVDADNFLAFEFIKLQGKPQFGCELFTKYELLSAWLQMRLMCFTSTTDFGICYHLASNDLSLQLKQLLKLNQIEQLLMQQFRINPNQLMSNLNEFLKLLSNMPAGKYMLRYSPKYNDKFLLCVTSQEIAQNTVFLHGLFEAEPTNLTWMTQQRFVPISETLCSAVHVDNKILPCAFLPMLPGQKNLETAETRFKRRKNFLAQIAIRKSKNLKEKDKLLKARKRTQKRKRQKTRAKAAKVTSATAEQSAEEEIIV